MLIVFAAIQDREKRCRLEELYKKHASCMYKAAYRVLNDQQLAEDAVHEAFIRISNHFAKIRETDCNKTRALLVIIVRNVAIDIYRRRKKQSGLPFEELEESLADDGQGVEDIVIDNETLNRAAEKIRELPPSYADILSLKYFYGYENEEISQIFNITPQNFRTRLHRARRILLKLLAKEQEATDHE